ncbi:MAG: hypothetical protein ABUL62_03415 [Myxococcales bacterium]
MRASLVLGRARGAALAVAAGAAVVLGASFGCANKRHAPGQPGSSAAAALTALPEPAGVLGELSLAHPDATYRALRELGRPLSSLLPAGFPMFAATLAGLPPLSADSFDADLPAVGLLVQGEGQPGWVLAAHVVSGPELVAKLTTGDRAPFRALTISGSVPGLKSIEPSPAPGTTPAPAAFSLAVFDNYLLVGSSAEVLKAAGPYTARMLPRRPPASAPIALRFSQRALDSNVVPALRALWAGYRTRLTHLDQSSRSAHGGRAPDFADPAQVILGADAVVESLFALLEGASALELDLAPFDNRLDVTIVLEPEASSEVSQKLAALAPGNARGLLGLPAETELALGLSRSSEEREAAGKAAGEDWVRLLGGRLSEHDAQQLRAVLSDWELGRGSETRYGFLGGSEPGAFLVAQVADTTRLKRAGSGLLGLLALPGVRAPLVEFVGQPQVSDATAPADALPNVTRKKLVFTPGGAGKPAVPPLSFAWLVEEQSGFAAASKHADAALKVVVQSAHGEHPTLAAQPGLSDAVERVGEQAALFAYLDARLAFGATGAASPEPAPLLISIAKRGTSANLRLEIAKPVVDLALRGVTGQ